MLLEYKPVSAIKQIMIKKPIPGPGKKKEIPNEKEWENPNNPEKAADPREIEKLERAKKEAERRNENLTDEQDNEDK